MGTPVGCVVGLDVVGFGVVGSAVATVGADCGGNVGESEVGVLLVGGAVVGDLVIVAGVTGGPVGESLVGDVDGAVTTSVVSSGVSVSTTNVAVVVADGTVCVGVASSVGAETGLAVVVNSSAVVVAIVVTSAVGAGTGLGDTGGAVTAGVGRAVTSTSASVVSGISVVVVVVMVVENVVHTHPSAASQVPSNVKLAQEPPAGVVPGVVDSLHVMVLFSSHCGLNGSLSHTQWLARIHRFSSSIKKSKQFTSQRWFSTLPVKL